MDLRDLDRAALEREAARLGYRVEADDTDEDLRAVIRLRGRQ